MQALIAAPLAAVARTSLAHEHHHEESGTDLKLSTATVNLPALSLTRQDGIRMALAAAIDDNRPVFLDFIFTSCTAICPVLSQVFAETRDRLGAKRHDVRFVSISIDPDFDTPGRLREYGARFGADADWSFFTGSQDEATKVQRAFGIDRGDKMNHSPITFAHAPHAASWTRFDGFASPRLLIDQYHKMASKA